MNSKTKLDVRLVGPDEVVPPLIVRELEPGEVIPDLILETGDWADYE